MKFSVSSLSFVIGSLYIGIYFVELVGRYLGYNFQEDDVTLLVGALFLMQSEIEVLQDKIKGKEK